MCGSHSRPFVPREIGGAHDSFLSGSFSFETLRRLRSQTAHAAMPVHPDRISKGT
jgi:hypothetical protein